MELKRVNREIKEIEIGAIIRSVAELLELEIKKKELEVKFIMPDAPVNYPADNNEMTRLFTNLLSNAVKYNRAGGNITVEICYRDNYIDVRISDTGIGMKPEDKAKLFTEFFRAKNEKTRGISGTGLGLSIVKRIVDSYSGIIDVESEYGLGSSFIVRLPLQN
jgi:signal transduction histidine kinase